MFLPKIIFVRIFIDMSDKNSVRLTSYQDTLDFLYSQLPMYQRTGAPALKYDLSRIAVIVERLGNPHRQYPVIHVAGTNGKGSVCHMLAAILQVAGYTVGLHTSPHYIDFRERVKINGQLISESEVIRLVNKTQTLLADIKPSFFEMSVALAFAHFAEKIVDFAVIETGLGGRLDSTNIVQPILSVITNIGYDHQEFLGDSLEEIAMEKAGIIKNQTPVVIGEADNFLKNIFTEYAHSKQAPIHFSTENVKLEYDIISDSKIKQYELETAWFPDLKSIEVEIQGPFQQHNIKTVIQSIGILSTEWKIRPSHIREGLSQLTKLTNFMGRWTWLSEFPSVLMDSAHNEAGLSYIAEWLNNQDRNLHIVLGMVKNKEPQQLLKSFPRQATYYFCSPSVPRGMSALKLQQCCAEIHLSGNYYSSVEHAVKEAMASSNSDDLIFIGGSSFVVADVLIAQKEKGLHFQKA